MIRRALVPAIAAVAVLLAACGSDEGAGQASEQGTTKITFVTGAPPGGKLANVVAAQRRGYFRAEGIDVEIKLLSDTSDALKLVAAGDAQVGLVNSLNQIIGRAQGANLVSLGTTLQRATHTIMSPADAPIETPAELEGRTVGMTGFAGNQAMLEDIIRRAGGDPSNVKFVDVGFNGAEMLAKGTVDALGDAILWSIPQKYNALMDKPLDDTSAYVALPYSDLGAPRYYSLNIATSERYLDENAPVVQRFVRASRKGLEWSVAHPDDAAQLVVKQYPELKLPVVSAEWNALVECATSDDTDQHGIGWQSVDVWRGEEEFLRTKGFIEKPVDVTRIVKNDYLGEPAQ